MTKTSAINRIHDLLDDNSFVEVGAYITARSTDYNMQSQETPADGVVTGYGTINGALVYVYSQDASVMGGSIGEMHAKKIEKLYNMARKWVRLLSGLLTVQDSDFRKTWMLWTASANFMYARQWHPV